MGQLLNAKRKVRLLELVQKFRRLMGLCYLKLAQKLRGMLKPLNQTNKSARSRGQLFAATGFVAAEHCVSDFTEAVDEYVRLVHYLTLASPDAQRELEERDRIGWGSKKLIRPRPSRHWKHKKGHWKIRGPCKGSGGGNRPRGRGRSMINTVAVMTP